MELMKFVVCKTFTSFTPRSSDEPNGPMISAAVARQGVAILRETDLRPFRL